MNDASQYKPSGRGESHVPCKSDRDARRLAWECTRKLQILVTLGVFETESH